MKKKSVFLTIVGSVLLGAMILLAGCGGPTPEEAITDQVNDIFGSFENGEGEWYDSFKEEFLSGEAATTDDEALFEAIFDGFTYSIDEVSVDEEAKTGVATVTVEVKSLTDAFANFFENLDAVDEGTIADMTEDESDALFTDMLMDAIETTDPTSSTFDVLFEEDDDGNWDLAEGEELDGFATAITGDESDFE